MGVSKHISRKRGTTGPALVARLTDAATPVPLAGAQVRLIAVDDVRGTVVLDEPVTGDDDGRATLPTPLPAALTQYVRDLRVEFDVTRGGVLQTYPDDGHLMLSITPDLA